MNENYSNMQPTSPTPPHMPPPQGSNGKAIASMVLGIVSVVLCCLWFLSFPLAIVGLVLGIVSRKNNEDGKGMAIAGIALSSVALLLSLVYLVYFVIIMSVGMFDVWQYL